MKYRIEEAIIVETYEKEPSFVDKKPVKAEIISDNRKTSDSFFDLLESFFFPFISFDSQPERVVQNNTKPKPKKPENAVIVESDEIPVKEVFMASFKILY